jgi:hypothetical protein
VESSCESGYEPQVPYSSGKVLSGYIHYLLLINWNVDIICFYWQSELSTFLKLMCWVKHHPPVLIVSWWGRIQWVNPLQPSIRSTGQSFLSLLLCCSSSKGCSAVLLWFPSLSWWFIILYWRTSLMNGTFRSSCRVWLVTYQDTFVIIRSILDCLHCILAICDLLAHPHNLTP